MVTGLVAFGDVLRRAARSKDATTFPIAQALGFDPLDDVLGGGVRAGELVLLGGAQGLGKTTMALQMMRNVLVGGGSAVYFSFEHEEGVLLHRLLAIEAAEESGLDAAGLDDLRARLLPDGRPIEQRLAGARGALAGYDKLVSYGERLKIYREPAGRTTIEEIRTAVMSVAKSSPLVVVDYLQKVAEPGASDEESAAGAVAEGLKDLAMQCHVPVLAIVAADRAGLAERRMRIHHLRGTSALAYEADAILVLNEKYALVARHHLVYDVANAERFRDYVVLSVEKNRSGRDRVDLEFAKEFAYGRFDPLGRQVGEQLVDDRVYVD